MNNEELIKKVFELETRLKKLEQGNNQKEIPISNSKRAKISITEFLREKKPSTNVEKALVLGVFHERNSELESFGTEDLLTLWRQAKETLPANINDLINKNVIKGLIAEETLKKDGKKNWYITSSGIDAVDKLSKE